MIDAHIPMPLLVSHTGCVLTSIPGTFWPAQVRFDQGAFWLGLVLTRSRQNILMKACKVRKLGLDLACSAFGGNQSSSINLTEAWEHSPKNQAVTTSIKYQFHHEYNTSSRVLCFDVLLISANELESFGLLVWLLWSVPHPGWLGGVIPLIYKKSRASGIVKQSNHVSTAPNATKRFWWTTVQFPGAN